MLEEYDVKQAGLSLQIEVNVMWVWKKLDGWEREKDRETTKKETYGQECFLFH